MNWFVSNSFLRTSEFVRQVISLIFEYKDSILFLLLSDLNQDLEPMESLETSEGVVLTRFSELLKEKRSHPDVFPV